MTESKMCKIVLSDGRSVELQISPTMKNEELLNIAASNFNLRGRSLFGLAFVDQATDFVHLLKRGDPNQCVLKDDFVKEFCKDHPRETVNLELRVLYCIEEFIALNDPVAVELFYLNAKRALCDGLFDNILDNVIDLVAHTFLIEYGTDLVIDFVRDQLQSSELVRIPIRVLKQFRNAFDAYDRVYTRYVELCRQQYTPFDAFMKFMNRVESFQTYGRHIYELKTRKGIPCFIGVSLQGIDHYEHTNRYQPQRRFTWDVVNSFMARDVTFSMEVLTKGRVAQQAGNSFYESAHDAAGDAFDPLASAFADPTTQLSTSKRLYEAGGSVMYQWCANGARQARSMVSVIGMMHAYHCARRNEKLPTEIDGFSASSISTGIDMRSLADYLARRVNERRAAVNASPPPSDSVSMRSYNTSAKSSKQSQSDTGSVITVSVTSMGKRLDAEGVKQRRSALQASRESLSKLLEQKRRELLDVCLREYMLTGKLPPETPPLGDTALPAVRKRPSGAGVQRRHSNLNVVKQMRNSVVFSPTNSPFDAYNSSPFQSQPIAEIDESIVSYGSFRGRPSAQVNPGPQPPAAYAQRGPGPAPGPPAYGRSNAYPPPAHYPSHLTVFSNVEMSRSLEDLNRNSSAASGGASAANQPQQAVFRQNATRNEVSRYPSSTVRLLPRAEPGYNQTLTRRDTQPVDSRSAGPRYTLKQAVPGAGTGAGASSANSMASPQNYTIRSAVGNPSSSSQSMRADSMSLGNDEVDAVSIGSTQSGSLLDSGPNGSYAYTYDLQTQKAPHFVRLDPVASNSVQSQLNQLNSSVSVPLPASETVSLASVRRPASNSVSGMTSSPFGSPQLNTSFGPDGTGDRNDSAECVYKVVPAPETVSNLNTSNQTQMPMQLQSSPYSVTVLRTRGANRPSPLGVSQKRLSTSDTQLNQAGLSFVADQSQAQPQVRDPSYSVGESDAQQTLTLSSHAGGDEVDSGDGLITLRHSAQLNPSTEMQSQSHQLYPGNYRESTQFVALSTVSPGAASVAPDLSHIFSNNVRDRVRGLGYVPEKTGQFWYSGSSSFGDQSNDANRGGSGGNTGSGGGGANANAAPAAKGLPRFV